MQIICEALREKLTKLTDELSQTGHEQAKLGNLIKDNNILFGEQQKLVKEKAQLLLDNDRLRLREKRLEILYQNSLDQLGKFKGHDLQQQLDMRTLENQCKQLAANVLSLETQF